MEHYDPQIFCNCLLIYTIYSLQLFAEWTNLYFSVQQVINLGVNKDQQSMTTDLKMICKNDKEIINNSTVLKMNFIASVSKHINLMSLKSPMYITCSTNQKTILPPTKSLHQPWTETNFPSKLSLLYYLWLLFFLISSSNRNNMIWLIEHYLAFLSYWQHSSIITIINFYCNRLMTISYKILKIIKSSRAWLQRKKWTA